MNIKEFKKDDIVMRTRKSKAYGTGHRDGSFLGEPLKLIDIIDELLIVEHVQGIHKGSLTKLSMEQWDEGWEVVPDYLLSEDRDKK